ncbi:MAG: hypothetical protein CVU78_02565 [Elusimicrobia bacterium HGW-Elusimicrobia-2]|nr:MAG: hypothetical protein CVU78_02565 [Elusimicrobia bacterium HGW-Elusimicrobia-2]
MKPVRVGIVTAWAECGMGHIARNWAHSFDKHPGQINYSIFSRGNPWLTPLRWHGEKIVEGPESMDIDHPLFWDWVEDFKPEILLFQDQNIYGKSGMKEESGRLHKKGIKLINYPDWFLTGMIEKMDGIYDLTLAHTERNFRWLKEAGIDNTVLIRWGVILDNFKFIPRKAGDKVRFYTNVGYGSRRKGYQFIPGALEKMKGGFLRRVLAPRKLDFVFTATAQEEAREMINPKFIKYFEKNTSCEFSFKTADNTKGGLFNTGDVYVYPTWQEGVGLTITEAMASGMPVVTTDFPTMNEWLDDGVEGRLIKVKKLKKGRMTAFTKAIIDTSHLAGILEDYINKPSQIEEQSYNARKKIEKDYNWDDRDDEILALMSK